MVPSNGGVMRARIVGIVISTVALAVSLSVTLPSHAIENCKVKIDRRDGTLLVFAKNVGANPRWCFVPPFHVEVH